VSPAPPIVIVGAGAAGIMAAIFAAEARGRVVLVERTRDGGRKILISGGGRCNVLPSVLDPSRFVTDSSPHTLRNILRSWPLEAQREFFEETLGLGLTLEPETGKLFPASNRARDVRDRLLAEAARRGVEIRFDALIEDVRPSGSGKGWELVPAEASSFGAGAVILATGGLSVPATGSDGLGIRIARRLGHAIHDTYPALTPLVAEPPVHAMLAGVSLAVTLHATVAGRRVVTRGGFLFTHRGYSGPAVLDISHVAARARQMGVPQPILVQWSARDARSWETRLEQRSAGSVMTALKEELPARLAERLLLEAGIPGVRTLSQLRRDERQALIERLTRYPLPWTGDEGYRKAEVTGGGVALEEVDPRTMESRRHPGLFFCGEMLDAFGPIGGHNFAWAWVTGRAAGMGAGRLASGPPA